MFDFGFWELSIVMVVALLVVGPERLPKLAGQAGRWLGKAKRILAGIRSDIESEIKASELKEILEKQQGEIGELKDILKGTQQELEKDFDQDQHGGDRELIKAVEEHIESNKQQELTLSSEAKKHEAD
jgi:sec-independent protein translocase protein TatB